MNRNRKGERMAVDIESIVGKENMNLDARERVQTLLRGLPQTVTTKRYLYARWLRLLGQTPGPGELDAVGKV